MVDGITENNLGDADINAIPTDQSKFHTKTYVNLSDSICNYDLYSKLFLKFLNSTSTFIITFLHTIYTFLLVNKEVIDDKTMSRRPKHPEPLGPVYIVRSVRDQIGVLQEKRGISSDENNFINLLSVIIQQSGQAMYAVFTMFLALLPAGNIIIHTLHFMLDKLLDVMTTKKRKDLWFKGTVFILQLIFICLVIHFVFAAIFAPIFAMQTSIVAKILFMEESQSVCGR